MTLKLVFNPFTGTLDWIDEVDTSAFAAAVPTYVAPTATFFIPADTQALFTLPIDDEGTIDAEGVLVWVG